MVEGLRNIKQYEAQKRRVDGLNFVYCRILGIFV
jgi:hypothetical protein